MQNPNNVVRPGRWTAPLMATLLSGVMGLALLAPAHAQGSAVNEYGEVPGVAGVAKATVVVEPGNYATLIAVARAFGGTPVGEGSLARAGVGVDIYVDDEICSADRDLRRGLDVESFEGKFATSATCMTVLGPGQHTLMSEKISVNVEGAKMTLKYTVLGGRPDKSNVATQ